MQIDGACLYMQGCGEGTADENQQDLFIPSVARLGDFGETPDRREGW